MSDDREAQMELRLTELLGVDRFEPSPEFRKQALISDDSLQGRADADLPGFWLEQARSLDWAVEPSVVLDDANPPFYRWFTDGRINASYNCLDRHVEAGRGDRVAFHWHGEEGMTRAVTYADLLRDVERLANVLKVRGVGKGDVVGIYLPMIPEVVVAMLACARIGAPHNVVFGGFSAESVRRTDGGLRGAGAHHGRRRPPQGPHRAGQGQRRRGHGRPGASAHDRRRPHHRRGLPDDRRPRRLL